MDMIDFMSYSFKLGSFSLPQLASLPALEILDISRNKLRRLPVEPGRLLNLRVLSISNNKLRRLPTYMPQMKHLCILKVDQNPLEWPPPHIAEMPLSAKMALPIGGNASAKEVKEGKRTEERVMNTWIRQLKSWMSESLAHERQAQTQAHSQQLSSTPPPPSSSGSSSTTVSTLGALARRAARETPGSGGSVASVGTVAPSLSGQHGYSTSSSWSSVSHPYSSPQQTPGRAGLSNNDQSRRISIDRGHLPSSSTPTNHSPNSSTSPIQDRSYMRPLVTSSAASPASSGSHNRHVPSSSLSMNQSMTSSDSSSSSGAGFGFSQASGYRGNRGVDEAVDSSSSITADNSEAYDESSFVGEKEEEQKIEKVTEFKATGAAPQPPVSTSTSSTSMQDADISPKTELIQLVSETDSSASRYREEATSKDKDTEKDKDSLSTSQTELERERARDKKSGRMASPLRSRSGSGGRSDALSPSSTTGSGSTVKASPLERHASPPPPLPNTSHLEPMPPMPAQYSSNSPLTTSPKAQFSDFGTGEAIDQSSLESKEEGRINRPKLSINASSLGHNRNNSHTIGMSSSNEKKVTTSGAVRPSLKSKKSLPDMRNGNVGDVMYRRDVLRTDSISPSTRLKSGDSMERGDTLDSNSSEDQTYSAYSSSHAASPHGSRRPSASQKTRPPLPVNPIHSQSPISSGSPINGSTSSSVGLRKYSLPSSRAPSNLARESRSESVSNPKGGESASRSRASSTARSEQSQAANKASLATPSPPGSAGGVTPNAPVDVERNSYFRRLSTLPPSTISKAVPVPVLKFVDATRGVLFALSQIYMALKQYILFTPDERVASQFNRVLDIASASMAELINSLDRFDSLSRKTSPEPSVIRGVLKAGRDSVGTFRKVVAVLQLQLRTLQSNADVRYTRTLLLMLYGSMAEVGNSWQEMAPQVDAVLLYLAQGRNSSSEVSQDSGSATMIKTPSGSGQLQQPLPPTLPSIAEGGSPAKDMKPAAAAFPARSQRRRHAGSFSAQDVAQGAAMIPGPPGSAGGEKEIQPFNLQEVQAQSNLRNRAFSSSGVATAGQSSPPSTPGTISASNQSYSFPEMASTPSNDTNSITTPRSANNLSRTALLNQPQDPSMGRRRSPSGNSNSNGPEPGSSHTPTGTSAFNREMSNSSGGREGKLLVDGHTVSLVRTISETASGVWSMLLDHLSLSLGTTRKGSGDAQDDSSQSETLIRKLRDLKDLGVNTAELTKKLQSTLSRVKGEILNYGPSNDKAKENNGNGDGDADGTLLELEDNKPLPVGPEVKKMWEESNQFVRAVVQVSQLIKVLSQEHSFPREITRPLGDVTTGCGDLMLHMHFLNPSTPGAKTTIINVAQ